MRKSEVGAGSNSLYALVGLDVHSQIKPSFTIQVPIKSVKHAKLIPYSIDQACHNRTGCQAAQDLLFISLPTV